MGGQPPRPGPVLGGVNAVRAVYALGVIGMIENRASFSREIEAVQRSPLDLVQATRNRASKTDSWKYRVLDYVFVFLAAPFVLPVLGLILLWVKLDDPKSSVLYRQTRYGMNGRPFQILKVRTMVSGADSLKDALLQQSEDKGAGFKLDEDPRITRPGKVLRKLYLDELAQLWNVFRGDMSIVGPRANSTNPKDLLPWQRARLMVRPGVTGSWQIMRNKPRDFNERCRIDLEYISRKSVWYDISILLRTPLVIFIKPTGC
jgi:lipopolysaccharide/colanic/teichoic acid biosynthesis glycosyltransferase